MVLRRRSRIYLASPAERPIHLAPTARAQTSLRDISRRDRRHVRATGPKARRERCSRLALKQLMKQFYFVENRNVLYPFLTTHRPGRDGAAVTIGSDYNGAVVNGLSTLLRCEVQR